jgi:cobalt/nickel transport system permease protein
VHFNLNDHYQDGDSALHTFDPRVKVLAVVIYVLVLSLTPEGSWLSFLVYWVAFLSAISITRLGFFYTIRRSILALPFVLAVLAIPFTTPGELLYQLPIFGWSITIPGLIRFLTILLRAWLSVQAAILLTAVTRVPDILWALKALRIPAQLVAMIGFLYRYLFVLADEALRMLRARASRSPKLPGMPKPSIVWQGRIAGGMVGNLFLRSLDRSERVYTAMLARGYNGEIKTFKRFSLSSHDRIFSAAALLFLCAGAILGNWT